MVLVLRVLLVLMLWWNLRLMVWGLLLLWCSRWSLRWNL